MRFLDTLVVENVEAVLPVILTVSDGPLTEELIITPPNYPKSDRRNAKLIARLMNWAEREGNFEAYGCSAGFTLPNGAHRSPDACWIPKG